MDTISAVYILETYNEKKRPNDIFKNLLFNKKFKKINKYKCFIKIKIIKIIIKLDFNIVEIQFLNIKI